MDKMNLCSFYKIMVSPNEQFQMLRLPGSFTSIYGNQLTGSCKLTVPTGETYQVALVKDGNTMWFEKGWEKFVSRFSIGYGYFMEFMYQGNSKFGVNLFDLTACEISYLCDKDTSPVQDEPYYHGFSNSEDGDKMSEKSSDTTSSDSTSDTEEESKVSQSGTEVPLWLRKYGEEVRAVTAAGIPIPVNPFFVVSINRCCLDSRRPNGTYLNIPIGFARDHLKCEGGEDIRVEMSHGQHWIIRFRKARLYCYLGKGWTQFAREACLEVGDVCLFELIDAENSVLKVRVAKAS